jgi:hypothetical protein
LAFSFAGRSRFGFLSDSVIDLCDSINSKEMLFLPPVCFLTDMINAYRFDMPANCYPAIEIVAISEFGFRVQVILGQDLTIAHELFGPNKISRIAIEATCRCPLNILVVGRHGLGD